VSGCRRGGAGLAAAGCRRTPRTRPAGISDDHDAARWNEPLDLDIWAAFPAEYRARQFVTPNRLAFIAATGSTFCW
jgi:hypothetical protein